MKNNLFAVILALVFLSCSGHIKNHNSLSDCAKYSAEAERMYNEKDYNGLLQIPNDALLCDTSTKIRVLSYKAMGLMEMQRYQDAINEFTLLISIHPWDAPLYGKRALANDYLKNYPDALEDYSKALSLDSMLTLERNNRGQLYMKLDNINAAKSDFDFVIRHDSLAFLTYNNRGLLYQKLGKNELAIRDFETGLSIDTNDILLYNLSTSQYKQGDINNALENISKAIALNPNIGVYYNNRGYIKALLNDKQGACEDYQIAKSKGCDVSKEALDYCN